MSELGLAEYFGMAEALGIIATLFVILYFSCGMQLRGTPAERECKEKMRARKKPLGISN